MSDVQIIKPPHGLRKAKVGNGPAKLDPDVLRKAEAAVVELEKDFAGWAAEDLDGLDAALARLREHGGRSTGDLAELFRLALDMKGQGGSFGFQMITSIAGSLCDFLEGRAVLSRLGIKAAAAHISAMRAILAGNVRDDGGKTGQALLAELRRLNEKAGGRSKAAAPNAAPAS